MKVGDVLLKVNGKDVSKKPSPKQLPKFVAKSAPQ